MSESIPIMKWENWKGAVIKIYSLQSDEIKIKKRIKITIWVVFWPLESLGLNFEGEVDKIILAIFGENEVLWCVKMHEK